MRPAVRVFRQVFLPAACLSCPEDVPALSTDPLCPACVGRLTPLAPLDPPGGVDLLLAAHPFRGPARELVLRLKYGRKPYLTRFMAERMRGAFSSRSDVPDVLVPVPLPPVRRLLRGFNPAEQLARRLAAHWDRPVVGAALRRKMGHPSQTSLGRRERIENARDSFARGFRARSIRGRNVLLIDDVSTTGATLSACATLLRKAGASTVKALVFAWESPDGGDESDSGSVAS